MGLPKNTDETFQVGGKVGYDGSAMATAPVGVYALTIEKGYSF